VWKTDECIRGLIIEECKVELRGEMNPFSFVQVIVGTNPACTSACNRKPDRVQVLIRDIFAKIKCDLFAILNFFIFVWF
jgi:hypothetical protein